VLTASKFRWEPNPADPHASNTTKNNHLNLCSTHLAENRELTAKGY